MGLSDVKAVRRVGTKYVVEFTYGTRPATDLEVSMWKELGRDLL